MSYSTNEKIRNVFAVVAGVMIASILFTLALLILLLYIASQAKGHGETSDFENLSKYFGLISYLIIFICCFTGGFITVKISTRKDIIHGAITGIVLTVLMIYFSDFDFSNEAVINYLVMIPFTLLGTLLAIKLKRKQIS
jgi:uncharacterized membrane protein